MNGGRPPPVKRDGKPPEERRHREVRHLLDEPVLEIRGEDDLHDRARAGAILTGPPYRYGPNAIILGAPSSVGCGWDSKRIRARRSTSSDGALADRELLSSLRTRVALAEELLRFKAGHGLTLFDPGQEQRVLDRFGSWATDERVDPEACPGRYAAGHRRRQAARRRPRAAREAAVSLRTFPTAPAARGFELRTLGSYPDARHSRS